MSIDKKIIEEIYRYKRINKYLLEQDAPPGGDMPPPPGGDMPPPPSGQAPEGVTPPAPEGPKPVDVETDPEVQKIDDEKKNEIEGTDLVKGQKSVEEKQEQYFDSLFSHLSDLENKLSAMDNIINRLNSIEDKIEKYRVKTPEEKLELRTLDSGPYNQKLSQFFDDKQVDMEKSGKNEYILTPDDIKNYSQSDVKDSFRNFDDIEDPDNFNNSDFQKIY